MILGGRDYDIGAQRGEEVLPKINRADAARLVYRIRPTWKEDASPRDNYKAIRQLLRDTVPWFEQVMMQELDAHAARKVDALEQFQSIVAVVMMIHMDGVQQQLKELGWAEVDTW
jgi:pheromone shutdown protein TraB